MADSCLVWVLGTSADRSIGERLGDAAVVARALNTQVGVLVVGAREPNAQLLSEYGADQIIHARVENAHTATCVQAARTHLQACRPRLVLANGNAAGREWAALLAAETGWQLVSPALEARVRADQLTITALGQQDKYCRTITAAADESVIVTIRPGVAEAQRRSDKPMARVVAHNQEAVPEPAKWIQHHPANPATVDIRFAEKLVAGGRGLGSAEGFAVLQRLADRLGAGIAASRVAVDLGWIERERQVGQTGKTVVPDLYVACGISGASHHLAGMTEASCIVAINTDPEAPIFKVAHLGLVADLYDVLAELETALS